MIRTSLLLVALAAFAAAASAQQYKWVDRNGRVQYGDTPPPGVNARPLRGSARPPAPPAAPEEASGDAPAEKPAAAGEAAAKKGPPTLAERDAEFRKRREEAEKAAQKQAKAEQEAKTRKDNCERAQASARFLESGQRVTRTDASGERRFLEDAEIAQEAARARQMVKEWCGS
jgi:hypothetical protein